MIVLGIDPGFTASGYAIIKKEQGVTNLIEYDFLSLKSSEQLSRRVAQFHDFFADKIFSFQITDIAIETPFLGKNAQNFLKLGYLRGIVYLLIAKHNLALHEFSPREIKQAVTGWGAASKDQVFRVVSQLFPRMQQPKKFDVTDAIAIGLCSVWKNKVFLR